MSGLDRGLMRKLAKEAYKKLIKGTPKARRVSFAQAWPALKSSLEEQHREKNKATAETMTPEDLALVDSLVETVQPEGQFPAEMPPQTVLTPEVLS